MIEGIGRSGCDKQIFRHNDVAHIEALLQASGARPKLIVFESLYSMDGDVAPINEIAISPTSVGGRQNDR
jgi:5-aminolevulinate synthase